MRSNIKETGTTSTNAYSCQWKPTSQKCMGTYNDNTHQNAVNPITKSNLKNFWYCPYGDKLHKGTPYVVKNKIYCCDKNGNCPEPSPQPKYFTTPDQVTKVKGSYPGTNFSWFKVLACHIVNQDDDFCGVPDNISKSFAKNGDQLANNSMFLDKNLNSINLADLKFYIKSINGNDSLFSDCLPTEEDPNPCGITYRGNTT
jgi:hypothetical protein